MYNKKRENHVRPFTMRMPCIMLLEWTGGVRGMGGDTQRQSEIEERKRKIRDRNDISEKEKLFEI